MKRIIMVLLAAGLMAGTAQTGYCRSSTVTRGYRRVIYNPPTPPEKPTNPTVGM